MVNRKAVSRVLGACGIQPRKMVDAVREISGYLRDYRELRSQAEKSTLKSSFGFGDLYPCLEDRCAQAGTASGHYFHQDLLVARRIFVEKPSKHVDVGSRVDGFVAHVASFREIEVLDIRELQHMIPNVSFVQVDLMGDLPEDKKEYTGSLSCLHAIEHFGLGRYGDPVQFEGHVAALHNLHAMLQSHGRLYLSTPISHTQRIEFNAHRVFSLTYLLDLFDGLFHVDRFSLVDDAGKLHEDVELSAENVVSGFGCRYGCGIFEMTKH